MQQKMIFLMPVGLSDLMAAFCSETLIEALEELRGMYDRLSQDPEFLAEFEHDPKIFRWPSQPDLPRTRLSEHLAAHRFISSAKT